MKITSQAEQSELEMNRYSPTALLNEALVLSSELIEKHKEIEASQQKRLDEALQMIALYQQMVGLYKTNFNEEAELLERWARETSDAVQASLMLARALDLRNFVKS